MTFRQTISQKLQKSNRTTKKNHEKHLQISLQYKTSTQKKKYLKKYLKKLSTILNVNICFYLQHRQKIKIFLIFSIFRFHQHNLKKHRHKHLFSKQKNRNIDKKQRSTKQIFNLKKFFVFANRICIEILIIILF